MRRGLRDLRAWHRAAPERRRAAARREANAEREFTPVFVVGAIGSGTSLLAASLTQRFEVAGLASESARQVDRRSPLFIDRVSSYPSLDAYERALEPGPDWSADRARLDLLALYRGRAEAPGRHFVDKGPNANLLRASFLAEVFPLARFVAIFRDPVANVEGFRRKWTTFAREPLEASVRLWGRLHERFLEQGARLRRAPLYVEYEALVARYDEVLNGVGRALELPPSRTALPVEGRGEEPGRGLRGVEGGRIKVVRDANARSYDTLSRAEIEGIRDALGPLHARLRDLARKDGFAGARSDAVS